MANILKTCAKHKLLFYGTDDRYTIPEKTKEVFDSIPEPKMIYELNSDHNYRYHPVVVKEINKVIGHFVDQI